MTGELCLGSDATDDEPNPVQIGVIGIRGMGEIAVVQWHFSRLKNDIDGFRFIDIIDRLALAKKIVVFWLFPMREDASLVGTRNDPKAAVLRNARRQRDPGGRQSGRPKSRIETVLMPGYETRVVRRLVENKG